MRMSRVRVKLEDGKARFKGQLASSAELQSFQRALDGARYDRHKGGRLAPLDKVPAILDRLRSLGFDVVMTSEVEEVLERTRAERWAEQMALRDRIALVDAEIFAVTKERLFRYQITGAEWLSTRTGALLGDQPGLGKTRQAIVAVPKNSPVLVVCPAVAKPVWAGEMEKCRPSMKVRVIEGRDNFRWPRPGEMIVINYDILPNVHDASGKNGKRICDGFLPPERCPGCMEQLVIGAPPPRGSAPMAVPSIETRMGHKPKCDGFKDPEPCPGCHELLEACLPGTVVISDEGHYLKHWSAARTRKFRSIAEAAREEDGRTWILTGTPIDSEAKELWAVFQAAGIAEEAFGDFNTFRRLFKGKEGLWGITWGIPGDEDVPEIVERARRVMLRRLRGDVLSELPTKIWQSLVIDIDKNALVACERYLKEMGGIENILKKVEDEKLDFKTMSAVRKALATAKIPYMLEVIKEHEEQNEPLIVFSAYRPPIDFVRKLDGWMVITGDEDQKAREKAVKAFQAGELKGLGLTIAAGGTAITLTRGCRQLWVDRAYTPGANMQAEDRTVRIGQTRGTIIMMIEANHPLDRRVNEILLRKQKLIERSVDAASVKDDASLTKEERELAREVDALVVKPEDERSGPENNETESLQLLRDRTFETRFLERLAQNLVEEADALGLTDAQWTIVNKLAFYQYQKDAT
jgi:hypothetical protein